MTDAIEFTYQALPGRVVFAAGAARSRLAQEVDRLGATRVLLVTGARDAPLAASLGPRVVAIFGASREHVPVEVADAARAAARAADADAIVAIGGGSAIGTAKAVALTSGLAVLAVPTTYAGSEMTPVWGVTDGGRKTTGTDRAVLARTVLYDPELTTSLPRDLSVASALNALAHAVEAFWAPGRNPVSALSAAEGIAALADGLPRIVRDGRDLAARTRVLYGAYLAATAFAVAGAGLHHRICHVLGGAYGLPHARTHAVVLPYVLAINGPQVPRAAARIAAALRPATQAGGQLPTPRDAVAALVDLSGRLDAPRSLAELGLAQDRLDEAAELVTAVVPADNPRPMDGAAVRALLQAAWTGRDPLETMPAEATGGRQER